MEISGSIQVQKVSSKYVCNNIKAFKDEALIYFFDRDWPNCDPFMSWISDNWTTNLLVRFHVSRIFIVRYNEVEDMKRVMEEGSSTWGGTGSSWRLGSHN